jgi:ERCC4-type nuclease
VQTVATASEAELGSVDGIGEGIAGRIRWALGADEAQREKES